MSESPEPAGKRTFADKLNHLFETVHGPDGRPYSNRQVAEAITVKAAGADGPTVDHSYLSKLRAGGRAKPSFEIVEALAAFFGVKVNYFSDDAVAARIDAQLALVAALRDSGVRDVALRAAGVSEKGLHTVAALLDQVRQYEGLAPAPAGDQPEGLEAVKPPV